MSSDNQNVVKVIIKEWRNIPSSNGKYMVSNLGRIKKIEDGLILVAAKRHNQYYSGHFNLGKTVLETFSPIPDSEKYTILHKDKDLSNNRLDNLYWSVDFQLYHKEHSKEKWTECPHLKGYFCTRSAKVISSFTGELLSCRFRQNRNRLLFSVKVDKKDKSFNVDEFVYFSFNPQFKISTKFIFSYKNGDFSDCSLDNLICSPRNPHTYKEEDSDIESKDKDAEVDQSLLGIALTEEELKNERWIKVSGIPLYEVSDLGRVRNRNGNLRKLGSREEGYLSVGLTIEERDEKNEKIKRDCKVHRLVLENFSPYTGDSDEKIVVNHKNGNKKDNRLYNLEWTTESENAQHAEDTKLRNRFYKPVYQIDIITGKILKEFTSIAAAAAEVNSNGTGISNVLAGRLKTSAGYKWEFVDEERENREIILEEDEKLEDMFISDGNYISEYQDKKKFGLAEKTLYRISNFGRVISYNMIKPLEMSLGNRGGYLSAHLTHKTVSSTYNIHELVAIYFIPNPNGYKIVNHKDENKLNNHYTNLKWITKSENNKLSYGNGNSKARSDALLINQLSIKQNLERLNS
jgi:hypothetical protein